MVDQVRVAVSTAASGTWDIDAGGTEEPVAAQFYVTRAIADDTIASDGVLGWGVTDGTNQNCLSVAHEDAQGSSDTARRRSTTRCIALHNVASAFDFEFSFNSWITGGVRLNIDSAAPSGFLLTVIFFYSDDVSDVSVQSIGLGSTTSAVDYTGLSFEPDVIFTGHIYTSGTGNSVHSPLGLGVVYNDDSATPTQKSMAICGDDGTSSGGDQNTYIDNNSGLCATLLGSMRWELTFSDIDSTGFTHTCSASTSTEMHVLCMKLAAGVSFSLFDMNFPASGNYAETTPGFEPDFGSIYSLVGPTGYNSFSESTSNAALSVASFDGTNIYTNTITDHDGQDPTVCKSLSSDQLRILDSDGSTDAVLASSYAFDADGWDFTLSTNPAAAVYGFGWALKGAGGGATDITIQDSTQSQAVDSLTLTQSHQLSISGCGQAISVDNLSLAQASTLSINDSGQLVSVDNVTLSQSALLTVNDALQVGNVENINLTQANTLSVLDALHSVVVDGMSLTQSHQLIVDDSTHSNASDNVVLQAAGVLSVADALQQVSTGSVVLSQANILVVDGSASSQSADNLTLSDAVQLSIQDVGQSLSVDNIVLSASDVLAVLDAAQAASVDPVALVQSGSLVVSDSLHTQLVDAISLVLPGSTVIPGARVCVVENAGRQIVVINSSRTLAVH